MSDIIYLIQINSLFNFFTYVINSNKLREIFQLLVYTKIKHYFLEKFEEILYFSQKCRLFNWEIAQMIISGSFILN